MYLTDNNSPFDQVVQWFKEQCSTFIRQTVLPATLFSFCKANHAKLESAQVVAHFEINLTAQIVELKFTQVVVPHKNHYHHNWLLINSLGALFNIFFHMLQKRMFGPIILRIFILCYASTFVAFFYNQLTVSVSAEWSLCRPPSEIIVLGHSFTTWDIIWTIQHLHLSKDAKPVEHSYNYHWDSFEKQHSNIHAYKYSVATTKWNGIVVCQKLYNLVWEF